MALEQQILLIFAIIGGFSIIGACIYGIVYIYKEWDELKTEVTRLNFLIKSLDEQVGHPVIPVFPTMNERLDQLRVRVIELEEALEELKLKRVKRKRK